MVEVLSDEQKRIQKLEAATATARVTLAEVMARDGIGDQHG